MKLTQSNIQSSQHSEFPRQIPELSSEGDIIKLIANIRVVRGGGMMNELIIVYKLNR